MTIPTRGLARELSSFIMQPGTVLANRYEILEYVGNGGMGVVYKAHDRTLDDTVALKILKPQPFDDPSLAQRFLAEIKLARRVTHKNVCRIHDYGEAESVRFISMQFVEGIELGQMVRSRGRLSIGEGYDIALQLVDGLEAIHDQGIVHRDLKTSNAMIDRRGTALLMDFGIAKLWEGDAGTALTASGQIIGTPQYMSPEQAKGEPLDPRSDIYSFGVVLFELFTGALPFAADNFAAAVYQKLFEPLRLDTAAAAHLPESLKPVIRKALATAAADRYASTRELRAALLEARAPRPVVDPDAQTLIVAEPVASRSRYPWLITGVTLAAVLVLIALIVRTALPSFGSTTTGPPSTAAGSSTAAPIEPSTAVSSTSSTSPNRGTVGCGSGDAAACVALAQAAEAAKDFERAARLYGEACNGRAAAACTGLGVLYNRGLGVAPDTAQAAAYYERGCTLGDMAGCNNMGTLYQFGSIGFRDPAKAAGLYERACSNGHMAGCANLGRLLLETPGAAAHEKVRARELLAKACAGGIARACGT